MTSNIPTTVNNALPFGTNQQYGEYVQSVCNALTEREYLLSDQITQAIVQNFGVTEDDVRPRLESIGMAVRPAPEPEPEVTGPELSDLEAAFASDDSTATSGAVEGKGKTKARVARLEKSVEGLVTAVGELTALAQRHLGGRY